MGSAGALGDMSKTLNQFANQSRMMTQYWQELKTWSGLLLKDIIDDWGLLIKINALLITVTEVIKAIAKSKGLGNENFLSGMFETVESTNDEYDELQGKLLDFDKFRSLEGENDSSLIDEKLLQAISGYSSKIDEAENYAKQLADSWLKFWLNDDKGLTEQAESFLSILKGIGIALAGILALKFGTGIKSLKEITQAFSLLSMNKKSGVNLSLLGIGADASKPVLNLAKALKFLLSPLGVVLSIIGILYATNEDFRNSINNLIKVLFVAIGDILSPFIGLLIKVTPILSEIINVVAEVLVPVIDIVSNAVKFLSDTGLWKGFAIALGLVTAAIWAQNIAWLANPVVLIVTGITGAIIGLGVVIRSFVSNIDTIWASIKNVAIEVGNFFANVGIGVANLFIDLVNLLVKIINVVLTPIDAIANIFGKKIQIPNWNAQISYNPIPNFASGASDIDSGTVFRAGEFGKTEAVFTASNGKTNVANVRQMEQAFYNALSRYGSSGNGTITVQAYLDGEKVYENTTAKAKSRGNVWAKA
jgi:hypothetical protein